MSSDRTQALSYLNRSGMDAVLVKVGRTNEDTDQGYGFVIDAALRRIGIPSIQFETDDIVPDDKEELFLALATALSYDMVLPLYALLVDQQVDQPLTMVKASQAYANLAKERTNAWSYCGTLGYGAGSLYLGRFTTDWQEPGLRHGGYADYYGCWF